MPSPLPQMLHSNEEWLAWICLFVVLAFLTCYKFVMVSEELSHQCPEDMPSSLPWILHSNEKWLAWTFLFVVLALLASQPLLRFSSVPFSAFEIMARNLPIIANLFPPDFRMISLWFPMGFLSDFRWISHECPMDHRSMSNGFLMDLRRMLNGLPIDVCAFPEELQRMCNEFPLVSLQIDSFWISYDDSSTLRSPWIFFWCDQSPTFLHLQISNLDFHWAVDIVFLCTDVCQEIA